MNKANVPDVTAPATPDATDAPRTDAPCAIRDALAHLRMARDLLRSADAPKATDKVRKAMKSAEGALRNASVRAAGAAYEIAHRPAVRLEGGDHA